MFIRVVYGIGLTRYGRILQPTVQRDLQEATAPDVYRQQDCCTSCLLGVRSSSKTVQTNLKYGNRLAVLPLIEPLGTSPTSVVQENRWSCDCVKKTVRCDTKAVPRRAPHTANSDKTWAARALQTIANARMDRRLIRFPVADFSPLTSKVRSLAFPSEINRECITQVGLVARIRILQCVFKMIWIDSIGQFFSAG